LSNNIAVERNSSFFLLNQQKIILKNVFKEEGAWLEITNLVIPSWTDKFNMIEKMCSWLVENGLQDCPLHFVCKEKIPGVWNNS
jgi:hypothetical protein